MHHILFIHSSLNGHLGCIHVLAWRRQWQPTPVCLPGTSHGWRSLVGCSPWGCTEVDTTEATYQKQQQHVLAIVNSATMNTAVSVCFQIMLSTPTPTRYMASMGLLDYMIAVIFIFFLGLSILFSIVAILFYVPTSVGGFPFLHTISRVYCL